MNEGYSIPSIDDSSESWPNYKVQETIKNQLDLAGDAEVWELFRQGQEFAFIHIYKNNFDHLFQYGFQFTKNEALIEDAIQDMFIELREKGRNNSIIKSSIKSYLFTCLRRRILLYKKKHYGKLEPLDNTSFKFFEIGISIEQRIIEGQIREEQKEKLERALRSLSSRQREAIYYLFNEGMDYAEIKDLMNFNNIRSTRNLIYKAFAAIKSSLNYMLPLGMSWLFI